jgi:DNA-binding MarR family transcriptional regulator
MSSAHTTHHRLPHPRQQLQRLGSVEAAVLEELRGAGGLMQRRHVLAAAFPDFATEPNRSDAMAGGPTGRRRAVAEAALSRAVSSLERKGLVRRDRHPATGNVVLRAAGHTHIPDWERCARSDEAMEAYCQRLAAQWTALAQRFGVRASLLRAVRSTAGTDDERHSDLEQVRQLQTARSRRRG